MLKTKLLLFTLIILAGQVLAVNKAYAADLTVTCSTLSHCSSDGDKPLFSADKIYPGWSQTKSIKAVNNYTVARQFALEVKDATFSDSDPKMSEVLEITIKKSGASGNLYGPNTISTWRTASYIMLTEIPSNNEEIYDLTVTMKDVGNDYQGQELKFDITLGFDSLPLEPATLGAATEETGLTDFGFGGFVANLLNPILGSASESAVESTPNGEQLGNGGGRTLGDTNNPWVFWEGLRNVSLLFLSLLLLLLLLRRYKKR